jgi:hypothetical protein
MGPQKNVNVDISISILIDMHIPATSNNFEKSEAWYCLFKK